MAMKSSEPVVQVIWPTVNLRTFSVAMEAETMTIFSISTDRAVHGAEAPQNSFLGEVEPCQTGPYSCVAGYTGSGKTTDNDDTMFQLCIPSWVAFTDNGTALVGEAAKNHAAADPEAAMHLRRTRWHDEDIMQGAIQRVPYKIGTRDYDTTIIQVMASDGSVIKQLEFSEVASMVVAELKNKAEEYLGRTVEYAVMTVPFHFAETHRGAAEYAGKMAGLDVVWTVTEQTAAADAHDLRTVTTQKSIH
ncbi:luminal-binding protein-like [Miscanthus floridulus]|uniref:luminal-binding protein-like n=1 Tax=Miscanthus floridulus TaxID=154761 RepID=UPI003457C7FE